MCAKGAAPDLNPGLLAPEARIIPLDQAPDADGECVCSHRSCAVGADEPQLLLHRAWGGKLRQTACIMLQHEAPARTKDEKKCDASARQAPNEIQWGVDGRSLFSLVGRAPAQ